jgi:hypothetical protein
LDDAHAGLSAVSKHQYDEKSTKEEERGGEGKTHHDDRPGAADPADVPRGTAAFEEEVGGDFAEAVCAVFPFHQYLRRVSLFALLVAAERGERKEERGVQVTKNRDSARLYC